MHEVERGEITLVLEAMREGAAGAPDRLMALVYKELRRLAASRARVSGCNKIEATTLVNETYLRLFGKAENPWQNRQHFFFAAARAMRDILVERARSQAALKRGGGQPHLVLGDQPAANVAFEALELLALDEAMQQLERVHELPARIVALRFYAGLTREQIAEELGMSQAAVWREWKFARAWLHAAIEGGKAAGKAAEK